MMEDRVKRRLSIKLQLDGYVGNKPPWPMRELGIYQVSGGRMDGWTRSTPLLSRIELKKPWLLWNP